MITFGAVGDNKTEDTTAVQRALDACSELTFPAPGAYLVRPLELRHSGLTITVEEGATIVLWGDLDTYNRTTGAYSPMFSANESSVIQDVTFRGAGVIDGQGWRWWPFGKSRPRPPLFRIPSVQRLWLDSLTLRNSPSFHLMARGDRISVTGTRVEANLDSCRGYESAPNTDAYNVGGTNVFLADVFAHNGDDCIPLGDADVLPPWYKARNTRNVVGTNISCNCGTNSGVVILGAGNTSVSDVLFSSISAYHLNQGAGMKIR